MSKAKEIQSKAQAARVTIERDSPPGYACLTLSEKQANGRYKAVETLRIPNDTINEVIIALGAARDEREIESHSVQIGDVLLAWRLTDSVGEWSTIGLRGDTRVTSRGHDAAYIANGDRINLAGYAWRVRRAP